MYNFTKGRIFYHNELHYGIILYQINDKTSIYLVDNNKSYLVNSSEFYENINDNKLSSLNLKIIFNLHLHLPLLNLKDINDNYNEEDINIIFFSNNSLTFSYLNKTYYIYFKDYQLILDDLSINTNNLFKEAINKYLKLNMISDDILSEYKFTKNNINNFISKHNKNDISSLTNDFTNKFKILFKKDYLEGYQYLKSFVKENDNDTLYKILNNLALNKNNLRDLKTLDPYDPFYYLMMINSLINKGVKVYKYNFIYVSDFLNFFNLRSKSFLAFIYVDLNNNYKFLPEIINDILNIEFLPFNKLSMKILIDNLNKFDINNFYKNHLISILLSLNNNDSQKVFNYLLDKDKLELYFRFPNILTFKKIKYTPSLSDDFLKKIITMKDYYLKYSLFFKDYFKKCYDLGYKDELLLLLINIVKGNLDKSLNDEQFNYYINNYFSDYKFLIDIEQIDINLESIINSGLISSEILNILKSDRYNEYYYVNDTFNISFIESININEINFNDDYFIRNNYGY